ncbi:uncharacterized protein LOC115735313 [Rhodamnia argentea]|uniref:Uncharacterized protein LOC115735313 n=1 Tax=Rhodamnia argentea TaxID=178133 RepID=A0A8B8NIQ6_9MYRT|nr:uncharacterized protein LOC115735313 [Rhodamnia argentea]
MKFNMSTAARRQKWQHYPTPPTPRILQLPGRPRRRPPRAARPVAGESRSRDRSGKLEALFDQERKFLRCGASVPIVLLEHRDEKRDRIEDRGGSECEEEEGGGGGRGRGEAAVEEEKWRFQAEVLRAECNLLRMEREIAVKKLDRTRINFERSLKCAIQTLINGKKKVWEGERPRAVFDGEIEHLVGKLKELRKSLKVGDFRARNCSNFEEQATVLQRRLKKLGGTSSSLSKDKHSNEIRKIAEASLSIGFDSGEGENEIPHRDQDHDHKVDILTRKMEELSKDMLLERMEEEHGSILSAASRSAASSASISKRIKWPSSAAALICQPNREMVSRTDSACSGHCKSIVRRIIEQVRVETEQWSQMQEMLAQVRIEMEELQASRDFWEDRALKSDAHMQSLCSAVQEWRQRALSSEAEANELRARASAPQEEVQRSRKEQDKARQLPQGETEKRVLICRLKENRRDRRGECKQDEASGDRRRKVHASASRLAAAAGPKRSPFRDIGNSSPM